MIVLLSKKIKDKQNYRMIKKKNSCVILIIIYGEKNEKQKNTTLFEQFQTQISKSSKKTKLTPLTHKHMGTKCPALVQALQ